MVRCGARAALATLVEPHAGEGLAWRSCDEQVNGLGLHAAASTAMPRTRAEALGDQQQKTNINIYIPTTDPN